MARMTRVIEYRAPGGSSCRLTPAQIRTLEAAGVWPHDHNGAEYCEVSRGLHQGAPSWTPTGLREAMAAGRDGGIW